MTWLAIPIVGLSILIAAHHIAAAVHAGRFGFKHIPWAKLPGPAIGMMMLTLFVYGLIRFPDAPLHPCGAPLDYCGKLGQPHSLADFQAFSVWQTSLFVVWPIGMLVLLLLRWAKQDGATR